MPSEKFEMSGVPHWWPGFVQDIGLHLGIDGLREHRDDHLSVALAGNIIALQPVDEREVVLTCAVAVLPPAPDLRLLETCLTANLHAVRDGTPVVSIEPDTRAVVLQQRISCDDAVATQLAQMTQGASVLREKLGA